MADSKFTCECGCGRATTIAKKDYKSRDVKKGQPFHFVRGHSRRTGQGEYAAGGYKNAKRLHVLIAENALGKPLPKGAEVHHVDGNKRNNANMNLVICQDSAYHKLLHVRQRVRDAGGNPNTDRMCSRCKQPKPIEEFYKDAAKTDGIGSKCRPCGIASAEESKDRRRTKPKLLYTDARIIAAGGDPSIHRICSRCKTVKPCDDFPKDKSNPSGLYHVCKPCSVAKSRAYAERMRH